MPKVNPSVVTNSTLTANSALIPNVSLSSSLIPNKLYIDDIDVGNELKEFRTMKRKFDVLYNLLIQKGIFTQEEVNDILDSLDTMDKLTKEE